MISPGTGAQHITDAVAQQAQTDLAVTYGAAVARACPPANNLTGVILGSGGTVTTLPPGVYCFDTSAQLTGDLVLNGAGVYIFQIGSTLTTAANSSITLTNGASACSVWWQVGSSATLGTMTSLAGNILALTSITLATGATVAGGALARTAAVSMDTNSVAACGVPAVTGLTSQASPSVAAGASISDTATLTAGVNPTGTITFQLFGPDDAACSSAAIATSVVSVNGNGSYPAAAFVPAAAGVYRWIANYSGDVQNDAVVNACNAANESVVVTQAAPTLVTAASASAALGAAISDTATLSGGASPSGTITFVVFGPDDATCAGASVFTSTVTVAGNGPYGSASFIPGTAGTYRWIASYGGDANNAATADACNDANESVAITTQSTGAVTTNASANVTLGGAISDSAVLSGAVNPTGAIVFALFGPNNATCTGAPVFTAAIPVAGNGTYGSGNFTPALAGTYRWIANYGGDVNNAATTNTCNDANESVTVGPSSPTVVTTASAGVPPGGVVSDSAVLAGGIGPTGSILFRLYGPNDATCTGAVIFTSTTPVAGNATYVSGSFTPTLPGTYRWVANYSGDASNPATANACNGANENVVVGASAPTVGTTASASVQVGGVISDSALLSGAANPTGSMLFRLYGPNDALCTGAVRFTSTIPVVANGIYGSGNFAPTLPGTYRWVANYSGDANNAATTNACNGAGESVDVTTAPIVTEIPTLSSAVLLLLAALLGVTGLLAVERVSKAPGGTP